MRLLVLFLCESNEDLLERRLRHRVVIDFRRLVLGRFHRLDGVKDFPQFHLRIHHSKFNLRIVRFDHFGVQITVRRLERSQHVVPLALRESQIDRVSLAESRFEMLKRAETLEFTAHHDTDAIAQRFALLHGVRREHDGASGGHGRDDVPHETSRLRIHACGRFVQEDDLWFTHERERDGQFTLVPAAVRASLSIGVPGQIHAFEKLRRHLWNFLWGHSANGGVEFNVFPSREIRL